MSDAELSARLEAVTRERDALWARLAPRRHREARALAVLNARRVALLAAIAQSRAELERDAGRHQVLEDRRDALRDRLSGLGRLWARVGEPVALCALLVAAFLALGFSTWAPGVVLAIAAGALVGLAAAAARRARRA